MGSHGFETLHDGRFKMASVLELNDPFEGLGCCVGALSEQAVKNDVKHGYLESWGLTQQKDDKGAFEEFWNAMDSETKQVYRALTSSKIREGVANRTLVKSMYVLCFSMCEDGDPAQKLMWSHYANGYRGVRIGIRMDDPHFPLYADSVKYCWERPRLDLAKVMSLHDEDKEVVRFWRDNLITKSNEWAYERECRIVADALSLEKDRDCKGGEAYFWRFDPSVVANVDLGFLIPEAAVRAIVDVVKAKYPTALVRKVVLNKEDYGISYREVV